MTFATYELRACALRARVQSFKARCARLGGRAAVAALLGAAALLAAPAALATVTVNKQFTPATLDPGDVSRFRISFFNSSLVPLTAAAITDNLPAQVSIVNPANVADTCNFGVVTATPGTQRLIATGGTIPASDGITSGACYIELDVTSVVSGNWVNTIPANGPSNGFTPGGNTSGFQATEGAATVTNATPASATLAVRFLSQPSGTKTFNPSTGIVNEPVTLSIVLTNPNTLSTIPLTTFTDPLPAGMTVAPTPTASVTCTGTGAANGTLTANAGANSVVLTGGVIGASGTCTISVRVIVASITGATQSFTNTVPANAIGNTRGLSSASFNRPITVNSPITVSKNYFTTSSGGTALPSPIPLNTEFWMRIDLGNSSSTTPVNITTFTDTLPTGLVIGSSTPTIDCASSGNGSGVNGTISATPGAGSFTLTGGTIGIGGATHRCRLFVPVVQTVAGPLTNTIPAGAVGNNLGVGSPQATATSTGNGQLTVSKTASPPVASRPASRSPSPSRSTTTRAGRSRASTSPTRCRRFPAASRW